MKPTYVAVPLHASIFPLHHSSPRTTPTLFKMYFSAIASTLLLATAVSASPLVEQRKAHPEIIPGPGLPSVASLGLTMAQLYETPVPAGMIRPFPGFLLA
jgi:hypothetical protein